MGRCANVVSKLILGGCFVSGTLVTLSAIPRDEALESAIWNGDELVYEELNWVSRSGSSTEVALPVTSRSLQVAIEEVPIGARVPTKNPKPWEYDDSLPDPVQDTWIKLSITVERTDGGVVDAELIRPRTWVESNGIRAGQLLPLNIAELQVAGFAHVTAIEPCPLIADGEGSVITGRFITRQVDAIARVEILSADGSIEVLEGTTIHPIWSLDRNDWVPLGELEQGEQLSGQAGSVTTLSLTILNRPTAVYNVEVHGEHVYEVGKLALLVHNPPLACVAVGQAGEAAAGITAAKKGIRSVLDATKWRFPDQLTSTMLKEVKNVKYQGLTSQIKDYILIAQSTGRQMELVVRQGTGTALSRLLMPYITNGTIVLKKVI